MADPPVAPWLERLIVGAGALRDRPWLAYAAGLLLFGAAIGVRRGVLDAQLGNAFPFLTFFPAIVLAAMVGGRGPGGLCALLSLAASWYWYLSQRGTAPVERPALLALLFFVGISLLNVVLIDLLNRTLASQAASRRTAAALAAQRSVLFQELQHRVANNLATVGGMLALEERRLAHNPEAAQALQEARRRFELFARLHRRLHDPARASRPIGTHLRELCDELMQAAARPELRCSVDAPERAFDLDRTIALALLVMELVSNALKHAFPPGRGGRIEVALHAADGGWRLVVRDDGRGLGDGADDPAGADRLGMRILRGFATTLRGTLAFAPAEGGGTEVELRFPEA